MADNIAITAGTGTTVATDQVGANHYQRVKITDGTADSENHLLVEAAGNVTAKLIAGTAAIGKLGANSGVDIGDVDVTSCALPTGAATETTLAAIKAKTDNIPAQGQALAAASLPVVLTAAQVSTLTPPAAITNFANETGGNLASIKTNTDKIPALGQGAMAASVPVAIASNQSSIPVAATLGAETTKVIGTVNMAAAQTIATTNAGTFAVQESGSALTALQLIDDPVSTDDGAATIGRKIFMVGALADDTSPDSVDEGDGGMLRMSLRRELYTQIRDAAGNERGLNIDASGRITTAPPDVDVTTHTNYAKKYYTSTGAATDGIVWSPAAGKRWHVVSMIINVSAAATVTLEDDKAGGDEVVWKAELAANSGVAINFSEKYPLASGEDAADLMITTSAGNVYVTVTGYEV